MSKNNWVISLIIVCISVGAQLTLGGQAIFVRKCMYEKLYQLPEYYTIFARKIFFSPEFGGGGTCPPCSASYACDRIPDTQQNFHTENY